MIEEMMGKIVDVEQQRAKIMNRIYENGSITNRESQTELWINSASARMSELTRMFPIKRVKVKAVEAIPGTKNTPYMRYYLEKDKVVFPRGEQVVKWLDE